MVVVLTEQNFEKEVLESKIPVLVDFYSNYCPPCKMLEPIFEQLEEEFKGEIKFLRVNVDENRNLAIKYNIMGVPTLILFKDGEEIGRVIGLRRKEDLEKWLNMT